VFLNTLFNKEDRTLIKSLCLRKEHTAQKLLQELEQTKSSEAAKKLQTLVYLTGVQGAADDKPSASTA